MNKEDLKNEFLTGKVLTESIFHALINNLVHISDLDNKIGFPTITFEIVQVSPHSPSTKSIILVDDNTVGGNVTINLPEASLYSGKTFTIKKLGSMGVVSIYGNGTETIDEEAQFDLVATKEVIQIVSDGSNWHLI